MRPEWDDADWGQYMLDLDGQPGSCIIDLAWAERGPQEELGACALVRVPFNTPEESGLGEESEVMALREAEEPWVEQLRNELGAVLVATVRGGGQLDYWFYAPESNDELDQRLLDSAAAAFDGHTVEGGSQSDPEWTHYFEALMPDEQGLRQVGDLRVIMALAEAGDDGETPRDIEHAALFPDREAADKFVEKIKEDGFRVDGVDQTEAEPEDGGDPVTVWMVQFSNHSDVNPQTITPVTWGLETLAAECGGQYDGWQTSVITQ